jgi:hypothetical protein
MAVKTFTATRAPQAGDSKLLTGWGLSAGGTALVVNFCDGSSATPIFQVQLPVNSSGKQSYFKPLIFPNKLHVEVVSGMLTRGSVDLL